jgi:hypothetical protein
MKKYDLVYVEWLDAYGCSTDWSTMESFAPDDGPVLNYSVGWLLYDVNDCIVLVPHITGENKQCHETGCGDMTIPKCNIIKQQILRKKKPGAS